MYLGTDGAPRFTSDEERRFAEELDNEPLRAFRDFWATFERLTALLTAKKGADRV